jgi:hypothetical protein
MGEEFFKIGLAIEKDLHMDMGSDMGSGLRYLDILDMMFPWHVSRGFIIRPLYTM